MHANPPRSPFFKGGLSSEDLKPLFEKEGKGRFYFANFPATKLLSIVFCLITSISLEIANAADTMESLMAGARKETELLFVAGAQTFGGRKGLGGGFPGHDGQPRLRCPAGARVLARTWGWTTSHSSGGTIGIASWTPDGWGGELFRALSKHLPPPPPGLTPV